MIVKELIKSLEHFDEQEDIKNTFFSFTSHFQNPKGKFKLIPPVA